MSQDSNSNVSLKEHSPKRRKLNPSTSDLMLFTTEFNINTENLATDSRQEPSPIVVFDWLQTFKSLPKDIQANALSDLVDLCSPFHVKHLQNIITPHFQKDFINILPRELSLKIINYLSPKDLVRAAYLSKCWRHLTEDSLLWARKCRQYKIKEIFPPNIGRLTNWQNCAAKCLRNNSFSTCSMLDFPPMVSNFFLVAKTNPFFHAEFRSFGSDIVHASRPSTSQDLSLVGITSSFSSSLNTDSSSALENCFDRSKWKAIYLRNRRIYNNWRKRRVTAACELRGHDEHVITCMQTTASLIITGSDDHTLRIWEASAAQCKHVLVGHVGGVWTLQLSEDGTIAVSGSTDRTVRVWDTAKGTCIHTLNGHTSTVRCVALKDDILVSGSRDCTIRIWNIREGLCIRTLYGHLAAVRCVQFDGKKIISGGYDCNVIVWDATTGTTIHVLEGHTNRVYSLLYESERNLIVSGSLDTTIRIWNVLTGECLQTLIGHQSLTSGMQLCGNTLISGNADSTIKVWNILDGQCSHTLAGPSRHSSAVTSLQILDNGLVVTSGDDGTVKLWDIDQGLFLCDLVKLESSGSGGCVWRIKATPIMLICAVGSRNGTEDTKLILMDFDAPYP